jgi:hypothetical protein
MDISVFKQLISKEMYKQSPCSKDVLGKGILNLSRNSLHEMEPGLSLP